MIPVFPDPCSTLSAGALSSEFSSEEVRGAAAIALGAVAVGNLPLYLPPLLEQVGARAGAAKQQYQLLRALAEVLGCAQELPEQDVERVRGNHLCPPTNVCIAK